MAVFFLTMTTLMTSGLVAAEKPIVLKYSDPSPFGQPRTLVVTEWFKWLEHKTGNRIKVECYWSESLTKAKDNYKAVKGGITDMALFPSYAYFKANFPIMEFSDLPFLNKADFEAHTWVLKDMTTGPTALPELKKEFENSGIIVLNSMGTPTTHFMATKPISKLEDLKGLRIRAIGPVADFIRAAGGVPIGMTYYEVYEALSKGTIDGTQTYWHTDLAYKFDEVCKYVQVPAFHVNTGATIMNKETYEKLPKDIQELLVGEGYAELTRRLAKAYEEDFIKTVNVMKKKGLIFTKVSEAEMARWKSLSEKVCYTKWLDDMKARGVNGQKILDRYNELFVKYYKAPKTDPFK